MIDPSPSVRARFGIRFSIVARRWRREIDAELARAGLTDATWTPLIHLDEGGDGISQKQLASRVGVDASSLVRLLDILEGRGWIERKVDSEDARSRLVHLTPDGHQQVQYIRELLAKTEADLLDGISDEEVALALDILDRIDDRLMASQRSRTGADQ